MKKVMGFLVGLAVFGAIMATGTVAYAATKVTKKTLSEDTVFKFKGKSAVYYVASDGKGYSIPDEETYFSWFGSFSRVETYTTAQVANATSKTFVTVKPGARVVKFGTDPKLYAVAQGARIRWIRSEKVLHEVFSDDWENYFVKLPASRKKDYVIGADIVKTTDFDRNAERSGISVASEMIERKIVKETKSTVKAPAVQIVGLKSLKENITGSLKPSFSTAVNSYTMAVNHASDRITLTPTAYNSNQTIKVRDYLVPSGDPIILDLPVGDSNIPIVVSDKKGEAANYYVRVTRAKASEDTYLSSLTENLADSMSPKFAKYTRAYEMDATGKELSIKVTPKVNDSKSRLFIDGREMNSGSTYEKGLKIGLNVVQFVILSESGISDRYTITVKKLN